jgi:hypothetical protein
MAVVTDFAAWEADFAKAFAARGAGGSSTHFGYSYAKLGTSVCKDVKCKEKISKGALRVYKDSHLPFALDGSLSRTYYHPECFFTRVMARAHKWGFSHANELENYSTLTAEDAAHVQGLIEDGTEGKDTKKEAAKAKAQAKFDKAQARANAKLEKAEAKTEVDYTEVDAWTLGVASKIKARKEKAKAYYEARKVEKQEYQRQYREAHKEELKVKEKERNEGRKADLQTYQDTYREKHADELKAKRKAYNETHKEEVAAYRKAYNEAHKEELAAKRKARYAANRETILAKAKEAYRAKKAE